MSAPTWIYYFGEENLGRAQAKALMGGKGANLSEMIRLGLPVPTGFTVTTKACVTYNEQGKKWPAGLKEQVEANVKHMEEKSGKKFGDINNPLLLSVRSGAAISMPGMMDTVLNLGLSEPVVEAIAKATNPRFAYDSFRRFIQMFGDVVMGVKRIEFEHVMDKLKGERKVTADTDLTAADLKELCARYFVLYKAKVGKPFPTDAREQLAASITAVFDSWENPRAFVYRNMNNIPHDIGTAVSVQEMVFGNMGNDCATGVAFTRDPSTGENVNLGEYLANAQGEDVVAGIRTPRKLPDMEKEFPQCYKQLMDAFKFLENHYRDMQDIEFTIEKQKLFILQTRNGKRTARAAVKMAVDMAKSGFISKREAVMRVDPSQLETLMHPQLDPAGKKAATRIGKGLPASPGAAVGAIVFTAEKAVAAAAKGQKVVLVRLETSPEDITGMQAAEGILTARGGMTSHAAVVARGMNVCCIAGCSELSVDEHAGTMVIGGKTYKEGDHISLDGATGEFFEGKVASLPATLDGDFGAILEMSDEFRTTQVRANADTPKDAKIALGFGAKGIGLVRTEHMFFDADRILAVREMILAKDLGAREKALAKLLPLQRGDFHGILGTMSGLPVVIRLIDPPLHEFLPRTEAEFQELSKVVNIPVPEIKAKAESMHEFNPMLGFRGCRLGIVFPEINAMQVRAIFEASIQLVKEGKDPRPEIEIPLVGNIKEFAPLKAMIKNLAKETGAEGKVHYTVGTMIEVPRAALTADELAAEADFLSFGTNDLTQMTCGFSRDDSAAFLKDYVSKKIYNQDPFQSIDQTGVGKLMQICVNLARSTKLNIDIGICGEHGGDPKSVEFCHRIGLDNVSCSPFRVPIARLAASQAAIKYGATPKRSLSALVVSKL